MHSVLLNAPFILNFKYMSVVLKYIYKIYIYDYFEYTRKSL